MSKKYFNLVEITLAIAVLAVGMSSALLLFTSGANASREAGVENDVAEALNCVYAHIKTQCLKNAPADQTGSWSFTNAPDISSSYDTAIADTLEPSGWGTINGVTDKTCMLRQHGTDQIYLYRRFSGGTDPAVEFSALVLVKKDTGDGGSGLESAYFPDSSGEGYQKYSAILFSNKDISKYLLPLKIEIRYPASTAYDKQESRVFHVEFFNDKFQVTPQEE